MYRISRAYDTFVAVTVFFLTLLAGLEAGAVPDTQQGRGFSGPHPFRTLSGTCPPGRELIPSESDQANQST